ncbi:MAG: ribokinase [Eubacteriales bacterium]|nr:ribokinase [Eubacteriales bacterium]
MRKIAVLGSLNLDVTIRLKKFHQPGETVSADSLFQYPGGKGGNQAVAAARLGADVEMFALLGDDMAASFYRDVLERESVGHAAVYSRKDVSSGTAFIEVDDAGENRIAIVAGANGCVDRAQLDAWLPDILTCDILLLQLETPIDSVAYAAEQMKSAAKTVILDPAPAVELPDALYPNVDIITPNASELSILTGKPCTSPAEISTACRELLGRGVGAVLAKLGEQGSYLLSSDGQEAMIPAFRVKPVDTTGAGDTFNGALALALSRDFSLEEAARFANAAAALSTTGAGAQSAMPRIEQLRDFLAGA